MVRIAIIGGGIGGLTTAIALRRFGFEPEVYEQAPVLLDVGAAIALWSNAMRVLQFLGLGERVRASAGEIEEIHWLDQNGRAVNRVRINEPNVSETTVGVALHRADLQEILLQQLPPASVHLGSSLTELTHNENSVVAHLANGNAYEADLVIAADGIHSRVRNEILDETPPKYRGYTVWRGIAPISPASIPPATAIELHGCGKRFGLGPVGNGKLGWWASANAANTSAKVEERSADRKTWKLGERVPPRRPQDTQNELLRLFSGWYRPALQLIEATQSASILKTGAFDRPPGKPWGHKRITLLGDAIHPTTPNLGQGGCMAIEDAIILARCLEKYGATETALRAYENVRYRRTSAIAKYSRWYGSVGQWENIVARGIRRSVLSLVPETIARRVMQVVFDYDATTDQL